MCIIIIMILHLYKILTVSCQNTYHTTYRSISRNFMVVHLFFSSSQPGKNKENILGFGEELERNCNNRLVDSQAREY